MSAHRLVVLGTAASNPYAGMAWMHMQITAGLARLGHDVVYLETTSSWPYDPERRYKVCDSDYAVPYLARICHEFGLGDRWAYRQSFSDGAWLGPQAHRADEILRNADAVLNVAGATHPGPDQPDFADNLVYLGTDPVYPEINVFDGDPMSIAAIGRHRAAITYGENIGTPASPVPPLPNLVGRMRQPILIDEWDPEQPAGPNYTTVANWKQDGCEVDFRGERYLWSKDVEFLRFVDVPRRAPVPIELATNLAPPESIVYGEGEPVKTRGVADDDRSRLIANRWILTAAESFTLDPWSYRDFIHGSRAEFAVARDLNVRLNSGWFSERSACYLAAGRPVITQDTGFGAVLPTGEGLFAFSTSDEALTAIDAVEHDYGRHSRAAREIAVEYFRAETVLARMLHDLGL